MGQTDVVKTLGVRGRMAWFAILANMDTLIILGSWVDPGRHQVAERLLRGMALELGYEASIVLFLQVQRRTIDNFTSAPKHGKRAQTHVQRSRQLLEQRSQPAQI